MTADLWYTPRHPPLPDGAERPPAPAAPLALVARAVAAGAVAAALVPGQRLGAGTVVAALALAVAAPPGARLRTPSGAALAAVAAALVAVTAVRDAAWVTGTCLLAALVTWSLLLSGGRGWGPTGLGTLAVPLRWPYALVWLARPLTRLGTSHSRTAALPVARAVAVSALLLLVFGTLFVSADAAVRGLLERLALPAPGPLLLARPLVLVAVAGLAAAAALVVAAPRRAATSPPYAGRALRPVEWVLPLLALDLLFAAFVSVQLTVLFGGRDHVLSTAGLTYAQYAREGFGQLVAAAVLTLGVVAVAARVVPRSPATVRVRNLLLGALCLLTLVVLASAARRLGLYEQEFGFTRLRISVDAAIAWLAVVLLLVLAAGSRLGARWLPQALVLSAAAGLLVFAVGDPDARIAQRNVERFAATGNLDLGYLAGLSADAVPVLQALPEPQRSCVLAALAPGPESVTAANLSRVRTRAALEGLSTTGCRPFLRPSGTR